MRIPGNEEPRVLSPQLEQQQQFSNFSGAIPIKKRRFHVVRSPSPPPEEKACCSEDSESKDKNDSNSPEGGLSVGTSKDIGHPGKVEENKSFESIVKKELIMDSHVKLAQDRVDTSSLKPQEANLGICSGSLDVLKNEQIKSLNEKSAEPEVSGSRVVPEILNVKQELVGKIQGDSELEFSTCLSNGGLFLGANKPSIPALEQKISRVIGQMTGKSDLSSLSLASNREMLVSHDSNNSTRGDVSSFACVSRSNWDLNTTMDVWEGSVSNLACEHKAVGIDGFSKANVGVKASLSTSLVVGAPLNKGNQVLDEHGSDSSNTSVQRSQLYKPNDILSLSLSMPRRELGLCGKHSSLSDNMGSESVDSEVNLGCSQLPNMNLTFTNVGVVKSEPVDNNLELDCSTGTSSNMVLSKLTSVKKECFKNHSTGSIVPQKSVKYELVQEGNKEGCESKGAVLSQSVAKNGKVVQHQDISASSSALSTPLTPQNSRLPSLLTCLELPIVGGLVNQSERSFSLKEVHGHRCIPAEQSDGLASKSVNQNGEQLKLCKTEELSFHDAGNCRLAPVVEHSNELCGNSEVAANNEENMNKMPESIFGSDCRSHGNRSICIDNGEKRQDKEYDDYEDGEVQEPLKDSVGEDATVVEANSENVVRDECECKNNDLNTNPPIFDRILSRTECNYETICNEIKEGANCLDALKSVDEILENPLDRIVTRTENNDETICNEIKEGANCLDELKSVGKILEKPLSDNLKEVDSFRKKLISVVNLEKPLDLLEKDANKSNEKEISTATNESKSMGVTLDADAIDEVVDICPVNHNPASSELKASSDGNDVKESSSAANKSRIINLPHASIVSTPCKTRSLSSRLTPQTGKERYSNLDGDICPRWNRDELYVDDRNRYVKDRVRGQSFRNSRHGFMRGKGRAYGRFGRLQNEWDSNRDYESRYNGRADFRTFRHKQSSSVAGEHEVNDYGITPDGTSCGGREKTMNDELPSLRCPSLRRLSPGDIDGQITRNTQMPRSFPRNISPTRYSVEDGSDFMRLRHEEKFMRNLSDDIRDPVFPRQQTRYDELGDQLRRNRNFSAVHRKGYPQIYSKSPVRSRTRSPGPWSSPRQRSPNGHPDSTQQRSPVLYRMGRMRSPEQASCRDDMVPRRRVSPSYKHMNDLKDFDYGREHIHSRPINSNRRSPPRRLFPRSDGRSDVLDSRERWFPRSDGRSDVLGSRERVDGDEYSNRPGHSDRYQELCNDGIMDERRNLSEKRGFVHPFQSCYDTDNGNYQLHLNDRPKPYRFYQDTDTEFVERSNMRGREFDGHVKHPPLSASSQMRDIEEQQDGSHGPGGPVWHDDGFSDVSNVKRRRF